MGRIVDGTISGHLPGSNAFAINYPGYPSSFSSAMRTLGGMEALEKVRTEESNYVEVKFRPDDPFAHPAFGELRRSSDLVLRISKRARRTRQCSQTAVSQNVADESTTRSMNQGAPHGVDAPELEADIVAQVNQTYSFDGMADYQYVMAVHASESNKRKRIGAEEPPSNGPRRGDTENGGMLMLVPPLFSMRDMPEELFLRKPGTKKNKEIFPLGEPQAAEVPAFALDFKIKEVPKEGNWELNLTRGSAAWLRTAALVRLFQERPIWTRTMLNERLVEQGIVVTGYYLKVLLFRIAYYFGCGPFRNLWVRNGYDPRSDPESRAFQMIDFRVPTVLRDHVSASPEGEEKCSFADICAFKCIPEKKFTQFQLIDLQDDDIQGQIESRQERATCSELTGWYHANTIKRLRQIMRIRFLALYPGDVARTLEAVERKGLERSKFAAEGDQESRPGDEGPDLNMQTALDIGFNGQHTQQGVEGMAIVPIPHFSAEDHFPEADLNAHEEEDEDEEEVEDDVDPLDEGGLKTLDDDVEEEDELVDKMEELPGKQQIAQELPSGLDFLDPADSIPRNYLQALLGKFAFNPDAKDSTAAVDFDDEEQYTIYDQDDDDDN